MTKKEGVTFLIHMEISLSITIYKTILKRHQNHGLITKEDCKGFQNIVDFIAYYFYYSKQEINLNNILKNLH